MLLMTLGFNAILGMHWLYDCYANVDCHYKYVEFKFLEEVPFIIYGHRSSCNKGILAGVTKMEMG